MNTFEEQEYESAIQVCRKVGRVSTSAIQRHMRLGYVKAASIVSAMIDRGIAKVDATGGVVFTEKEGTG